MTPAIAVMATVPRLSDLGIAALELAQEYGFRVFPVRPRGKKPLIADGNGFHDATTHPEQIAAWWDAAPNANIGLYPGASQLIVLDVDGQEGEAAARAAGAFSEPTLEAITSRGVHRYFRLPRGVTVGNIARTELDIRAHNGYVLAPPSVHESGFVYQWRGDLSAIADIPPTLLEAITASASHATPVTRLPTGASFPARAGAPLASIDRFSGKRIVAYTDCVGYGLADGRKTSAYRLAAFYRFDVDLVDSIAWELLVSWNSGNAPPLDDGKLEEIFTNALTYARGAA